MEIGVVLPTMSRTDGAPGDVAEAARHVERLGFESAWVVDQLIAGTGIPLIDSVVALAAAAGATTRLRLGVGVLIVPLRPVVWIAKQAASLQYVSGGRLLLGVGAGGDRHALSWAAAGVARRERGGRLDAALRVLPDLIAGRPAQLAPGEPAIQLSPGVAVPPIIVGGLSDLAFDRAIAHGDGVFLIGSPEQVSADRARLAARAAAAGRPLPTVTANAMLALAGDDTLPSPAEIASGLADPDGMFGFPPRAAADTARISDVDNAASYLARLERGGAERVVVTFPAGDWYRQASLLAEAADRAVALAKRD